MINKQEVINIKLPFPNIDSDLARIRHMYICKDNTLNYSFVKTQTFKPTILYFVDNYIIENPDISRNPFSKPTLIDLDKEFHINNSINISREAICRIRANVCDELFTEILEKTKKPIYKNFDKESVLRLNKDYLSDVI